ncbi:MAG TPA: phosphotransferase [Candidatus Acidoferrales bacterium]|nr:phosphotransferase [Candidatus Acidoferrales bacterium]
MTARLEAGWGSPSILAQAELRARFLLRPLRRRDSQQRIFEAVSTNGAKETFILKIFPTAEQARRQYELLQNLWARFQSFDARYSVPRPRAIVPEINALLMEKLEGRSLDQLLLREFPADGERMGARMRQSGEWLSAFHRITRRAEAEPVPAQLFFEMNREELEYFLAQAEILWRRPISRVRRTIEDLAVASAAVSAPVSAVHGDFKLANVISSETRTSGIDIDATRANCVYLDVAAFLNDLDLIYSHPLNWRYSKAQVRRLQEAFLAGYFATTAYAPEAIGFFRVIGLAGILHAAQSQPASWRAWQLRRVALGALGALCGEGSAR